MKGGCCYCGRLFDPYDLRPYGVDGNDTCLQCAMKDLERKAETNRRLGEVIEAILDQGSVPILTDHGPVSSILDEEQTSTPPKSQEKRS